MLFNFESASKSVKQDGDCQPELASKNFGLIFLSILCFLTGLSADLLSKYLAAQARLDNILMPAILSLTDHRNYGLIGNFPLPKYLIIILTLAALVLVVKTWLAVLRQEDRMGTISLSFILAGALGNLTDRLAHGYVYDWILLFNISVINLADIMIALGIVLFIYSQVNNRPVAEITKQDGDC